MGKRHTAEEIAAKLRQVEVLCGRDNATAQLRHEHSHGPGRSGRGRKCKWSGPLGAQFM